MEQDKSPTKWQRLRTALVCWLWINAITAFSMQFLVEMSILLNIYNWLVGIGGGMLILETGWKDIYNNSSELSKPLIFIGWIIGIVGSVICVVYYDYLDEEMVKFGGR